MGTEKSLLWPRPAGSCVLETERRLALDTCQTSWKLSPGALLYSFKSHSSDTWLLSYLKGKGSEHTRNDKSRNLEHFLEKNLKFKINSCSGPASSLLVTEVLGTHGHWDTPSLPPQRKSCTPVSCVAAGHRDMLRQVRVTDTATVGARGCRLVTAEETSVTDGVQEGGETNSRPSPLEDHISVTGGWAVNELPRPRRA